MSKRLLLLPLLLQAIGPFAMANPGDDPLYFVVSPLIQGSDATIHMKSTSQIFPGDYYLFAFKIHYGESEPLELIDYVFMDEGKRQSGQLACLSFPSRQFKDETEVSLYLGANEIDPHNFVDPGLAGPRGVYYPEVRIATQKRGNAYRYDPIEGSGTVDSGYFYTIGSLGEGRYWNEPIAFEFRNLELRIDSYRRVSFDHIEIRIADPYRIVEELVHGRAEMRILNHRDEFPSLDQTPAYRQLSLIMESKGRLNDYVRYGFHHDQTFLYSRKDASMQTQYSSDCFSSPYIYLPLRKGHDGDGYDFQFLFIGLGVGKGMNLVYSQTVYAGERKFGPKRAAEYYVGISSP